MKFLDGVVAGHTSKSFLRSCVVAAGTGLSLGQYKEDLDLLKKHVRYSAVTGLVLGIPAGVVVAGIKRVILPALFTQPLAAAGYAFGLLSVRSRLANLDITYPNSQRVTEVLLTSTSSGASVAFMSCVRGMPILGGFRNGIFLGLVVHAAYLYICELRMSHLLHNEYPELVKQMIDAEKYMKDQQENNINYDGPAPSKSAFAEWFQKQSDKLHHLRYHAMPNTAAELDEKSGR